MNKTSLHDIQETLNIIRNQIDAVDADIKWAALELIIALSVNVVELAKKMTKSDTKTVTRTISIPKTKVIKEPVQQPSKSAANYTARSAIKPISPKSRYLINKSVNKSLKNAH